MAAVTGGDVTITDCEPNDLRATLLAFKRLGVRVEIDGRDVRVPPGQELAVEDDAHDQIAKIDDGPWPAFPADMTSVAVAVATQARGTVLIFEKMFENRLVFTDKLVNMGARIILCDPHRAVVTGPGEALRPAPLEPGHPRRHRAPDRLAVRRGHERDRRRRADRPRLRAHRRAAARARRAHRARVGMTAWVRDASLHGFLLLAPVFIISLTLHELAHAADGRTRSATAAAQEMGRLTLNPLAHLDPLGSLVLVITYFSGTSFLFGWAKPVHGRPAQPAHLAAGRHGARRRRRAGHELPARDSGPAPSGRTRS